MLLKSCPGVGRLWGYGWRTTVSNETGQNRVASALRFFKSGSVLSLLLNGMALPQIVLVYNLERVAVLARESFVQLQIVC